MKRLLLAASLITMSSGAITPKEPVKTGWFAWFHRKPVMAASKTFWATKSEFAKQTLICGGVGLSASALTALAFLLKGYLKSRVKS